MDISKFVTFIEENGTELEIARLRHILYGEEPPPEVVQPFIQLQNQDGGFPCHLTAGNLSTVDNTLSALWWLDELGMLESAAADQAIAYLLAAQKPDGGWDEEPEIRQYDLPPWINPGDLRTRLYLTAYAAYWLALRQQKAHPAFQQALDFLLRQRGEGGKLPGYLHTTWIATAVFNMAKGRLADETEAGLRFLLSQPLTEWADSQIAWALDCLGRSGIQRGNHFILRGIIELLSRHETKGTWSSEDGEAYAVGAVIGVLKALKLFNQL